ncbi:hypothetical protein [Candidatus Aquiluna sp. IMCC13023]|jgi:hypothetical protein|uniref:hypothetical protein n=1 Tax=Candidatus Aquiluna sp. IMCC13023 TaxID=1081644 RepID=UPI0012FE3068|nr:hypothetical protein [Candidatus Aquiluna sp. IMCC13023]|tara:strand:+ start:434 stop:781 length:348 start_codon:yes stop_codon:yes gene_type:complete
MTASPVENGYQCSFYCDHGCGEHLEIGVFVVSGEFIPWNQVDSASQKPPRPDGSTQVEREIHIQCPGCSNEVKISEVSLSIFCKKSLAVRIEAVSLQALALYQSKTLLGSPNSRR